jgi:hypothetical protein
MLRNFIFRQFAGSPIVIETLKHRNSDRACDPARIRIDDVLNGPSRKKYRLANGTRSGEGDTEPEMDSASPSPILCFRKCCGCPLPPGERAQ